MKRVAISFAFVGLGACAGAAESQHAEHVGATPTPRPPVLAEPAPIEELASGFRVTNYTLARESELSGQRSGNRTRVTARGMPGDYAWEFLCSNRGVAMQGTGVTRDGKLVHYVSGGGGFCGRDHHVCDCANARFAFAKGVVGATGRELVENFSIAVDPSVIPYGSFVWVDAMKRWFRADDTGGAIIGHHIDIYVGTRPFVFNGETSVFVTSQPHEPDDPGPTGADTACTREGVVCGGASTGFASGDPRMLYRCHEGRASFARSCPSGCRHGNGNADDACRPRAPLAFCSNDGWYCGGDQVDGAASALYHCADHALILETICPRGCAIDPDGVADACF